MNFSYHQVPRERPRWESRLPFLVVPHESARLLRVGREHH